jgi:hypothetical protein
MRGLPRSSPHGNMQSGKGLGLPAGCAIGIALMHHPQIYPQVWWANPEKTLFFKAPRRKVCTTLTGCT